MAMVVDHLPTFKHFCRICKKGFGCGRAFGGHMRAHGIGEDENEHILDDENSSDLDDRLNGNAPSSNKRMYALRTNPNRIKSCRVCANCGKEFTSWKSFLEHGECRAEDVESLGVLRDHDEARRRECGSWFKGKRMRRPSFGSLNLLSPSNEEEDLANCLVMLSSARVDPEVEEVVEESCASASREEEERRYSLARFTNYGDKHKGVAKGLFECNTCKKSFNSHQALGGHRASHKKVKGCFAAKLDENDDGLLDEDVIANNRYSMAITPLEHSVELQLATPSKRKSKVHECSICHRIFSTGQALGGHKRCHWLTSNSPDTSTIAKFHQFKGQGQLLQSSIFSKSDALDLNLPASTIDGTDKNPLGLEICLQPLAGVYMNENKNMNASVPSVEEEVESNVKLAKLNDLKRLQMGGDPSPWLQVGIGSTGSNVGCEP